jgi:hypothetical protein
MQVTLAQYSRYGGEAVKKSGVSEWRKRFKKACMSISDMKAMLITFFDIKVTVHFEFIPQGQTVNQAYYVEILKWTRGAVHRKDLNFGPMFGFSTMTILQLTRRSLSSNFFPKNRLLKWNTHPMPLI